MGKLYKLHRPTGVTLGLIEGYFLEFLGWASNNEKSSRIEGRTNYQTQCYKRAEEMLRYPD